MCTSSSRTAPSIGELVEDPLLVNLVVQLDLGPGRFLCRDVHVRLEDLDVLLRRGQLRADLRDLVFVGAAVELEQRLALFHRHVFLDQHRRHEGRLGQARNQLDGVLHHRGVRQVGRHEPQAEDEHQQQVDHEKPEYQAPTRSEPHQLELEENKPEYRRSHDDGEQCGGHGALSVDDFSPAGWRRRRLVGHPRDHFVGFALPFRRQVADVDHVGRLERPAERLDPRHDRQEADPAHEIDRLGLGMLAGNRDAAGQAQDEYRRAETAHDDGGHRCERHVVPEVEFETEQRFHVGLPLAEYGDPCVDLAGEDPLPVVLHVDHGPLVVRRGIRVPCTIRHAPPLRRRAGLSLSAETPSATLMRNRAFERHRLQRKGAAGASDQDVGADTETDADVAAGADIFAGERAGAARRRSARTPPSRARHRR